MKNFRTYINMRLLLLSLFAFLPMLLFSQENSEHKNSFTEKITYFTDSSGNEMSRIDNYILDIDSLIPIDHKINLLDIEDDGKGFFLLLPLEQDELGLIKIYDYRYNQSQIRNAALCDNFVQIKDLKVRGVAKISGVNVFVVCGVPKKFFKKVKTQKKISMIMGSETAAISELTSDNVVSAEPNIIAKISYWD